MSSNIIIDTAINKYKAVIMILLMIIVVGLVNYMNIPIEDKPDVRIPVIYVSLSHEGISPEDAQRLLVKPMEKELRNIEGIKEMSSNAGDGFASVILEFDAGFDSKIALQDVREKVSIAEKELPEDTKEPIINEINMSLFPVISVILSSDIPERQLSAIARSLRDSIEQLPEILEVDIAGEREETIDIILDPLTVAKYNITPEILQFVDNNNRLIAAGALDDNGGRYNVKVPGLVENLEDIYNLPIKRSGDAVVTLGQIAKIQNGYKDPEGFASVNGRNSLVLEVSKRTGTNIIDTIKKVRAVTEFMRSKWQVPIDVMYMQDESKSIIDMVSDLQNNIILAVLLVAFVIAYFIGRISALFITLSIPGAFLFGIIMIYNMGFTLNIVVLFALILSIGMLVDASIVVIEYANRQMLDNVPANKAYKVAAKRMAMPLIASTITTLIAFFPLLFWPGIMGQFMKFMPITLIATLSGSLAMALVFIPTLASRISRKDRASDQMKELISISEHGDLNQLSGFTGRYIELLKSALQKPKKVIAGVLLSVILIFFAFGIFGAGVEFFPYVEPQNSSVVIKAQGNLSTTQKDKITRDIASNIDNEGINVAYARSGKVGGSGGQYTEDTIGVINLEYKEWDKRQKSKEILRDVESKISDFKEVEIETRENEKGPPKQKDINIEIASANVELLHKAVVDIRKVMADNGGFTQVSDTRSPPILEWEFDVDRQKAARFGLDIATVGRFIKMVTNGLVATTYRPDDNDDEVDVLVRFPEKDRNISQLDQLLINSSEGSVPMSNFVTRKAIYKTGTITRVDGIRVLKIDANVADGFLPNDQINFLKQQIADNNIDDNIKITFKGEAEDQAETQNFLKNAFIATIAMMFLVLLFQFNSVSDAVIIVSAVFLSTGGVMLGLLITNTTFGIVMCGVGIIALAGIVVNNNIIFIDNFHRLQKDGADIYEAIIRTAAQRVRPILLTAGTTVLGLIPMITTMNINFIDLDVSFGAPSTQWWQQLSTAIAGGLTFATILTLFFTPCLLLIFGRKE